MTTIDGFLHVALPCALWLVSLRILGLDHPAPVVTPGPRWLVWTEFAGAPLWAALVLVGDWMARMDGEEPLR